MLVFQSGEISTCSHQLPNQRNWRSYQLNDPVDNGFYHYPGILEVRVIHTVFHRDLQVNVTVLILQKVQSNLYRYVVQTFKTRPITNCDI